MDLLHDVNDVLDILDLADFYDNVNHGGNRVVRRRIRFEPYTLPDREFKARYRFSKEGVRRLITILTPQLTANEIPGVYILVILLKLSKLRTLKLFH